jgi:preprotein translocase subunit YajC
MRRRQKKIQEFQDSIKVGDKVITTSGLYGQVTKITDVSVQLQIADKVRIDVAKASIGGYQGQDPVVKDSGGL